MELSENTSVTTVTIRVRRVRCHASYLEFERLCTSPLCPSTLLPLSLATDMDAVKLSEARAQLRERFGASLEEDLLEECMYTCVLLFTRCNAPRL